MRFDLHIHSNHSSDSNLSVDDILKQAIEKGLHGIAICDHNTINGSIRARERVRELNLSLIVLPGIEVSTTKGHLIILGVNENIAAYLSPEETIKIARRKGGLVIAVHPFKFQGIGNVENLDVDAIETFNSRCLFGENDKAKEMATRLGKPEVGGSDSHMLSTIGFGFTDIEAARPSEGSVLSAIREGKTTSGGCKAPSHVIVIQVIRGVLRRCHKNGRKIYSKILNKNKAN